MTGSPAPWVTLTYIVTAMLFIVSIKRLRTPGSALQGIRLAVVGMAIAVVVTLQQAGFDNWLLIFPPMVVGGVIGTVAARRVRMTAMPQMVAVFNGMGAGAAALIAADEFRRLNAAGSVPRIDAITSAPTRMMPWMALVPDIKGVWSMVGTLLMTSMPTKIASTKNVSSFSSSLFMTGDS